jgi:glycosyltransferase involved in cell wall biosynthesis
VPWLARAFALAASDTNARLVLVGDGPDQAETRNVVREAGLEQRVTFLGVRDALPELLAPATLFALASTEESFGLSALEAMACGTPVVATAVGGVAEVVEDGVSGLLSPPDDLQAFAARLRELILEPDRAHAMGRAARARAEEHFDRRRVVGRYEAVYRRLLEERA